MDGIFEKIFLMIFITFLFVAFIIPYVRKLALQIGAVDIPRERHIHKKPMPKLGGLAIFSGFLLGYMIFGKHSSIMNAVLIGSFIIVLTGVIDDITELKPLPKLIGQIAAAAVIAFYGNLLLHDISAFGFYIDFGILSYPITIVFIVACINCINLIDGLDGLSGGISSIYFLTIGIIATLQGQFGLDFVLAFIMLGSTLGFLIHNFYPATIFAGDSGAMFMGFIISVIALLGFKNVTMTSLIIPLLVLAIPILDTLFAILRRALKGESIAKGDKFHIHHQLLNRNLSQKTTVLIIYVIDFLFAFASIVYVLKDRTLGYVVYGLLLLIVVVFVAKTNVIIDRKTLKEKIQKKLPNIRKINK
ncbi:MAG: MraY family glycosyltransferase [Bacilli bacterium]|nr:MraY family glycosyltransferase [Bacilli bacterium]